MTLLPQRCGPACSSPLVVGAFLKKVCTLFSNVGRSFSFGHTAVGELGGTVPQCQPMVVGALPYAFA